MIVSTPQDLALIDAQKAVDMMKRLSIPLLGPQSKNMSYFVAPDTGKRYDIFGHGGAANAAAEKMGIPFLGEVPLDWRSGGPRTPASRWLPAIRKARKPPPSAPSPAKSWRARRISAAEMLEIRNAQLGEIAFLRSLDTMAVVGSERHGQIAMWVTRGVLSHRVA